MEEKTIRSGGSFEDVWQARTVNDPTPNDSLLLMAQAASGSPVTEATRVRVARMASWQRDDGHWITSDFRPPHSSSVFTTTATAISALQSFLPDPGRISKAREWLAANKPASTEDASFRVMGLVWAKASASEIGAATHDLLAMQRRDGGWGQNERYVSDAYSTGEAVFALKEAAVASPKGIQWLLTTQAADGTWHVRSRMLSPADVSPPYFDVAFPYKPYPKKDQFLSFAGSCWATMALLSTLPAKVEVREIPVESRSTDPSGLPPYTQLTVAASYYGNSAEVARLLDMGAPANPPRGTRSRLTPLKLASMSGDLTTVRLLLTHGADPNADAPLAEAVTFGHADVAQALLDAGASADGVESTGVNLLHWAAITNRASLIPILVKAGVPLNAVDGYGFTPLMYAATIDQGDTKTLDALLAAGADTKIRDFHERTPLMQARRLGHMHIVRMLQGSPKPAR